MNILIVHCAKPLYGGAELLIVELCKYLKARGHEVRLYLLEAENKFLMDLLKLGIQVRPSKGYRHLRKRVQAAINLKWPNVVNVHNFPATLTTWHKQVPTVYMCNEPAEVFTNWKRKFIEWFNRRWVRKSNMRVVVADEYNRERFQRIYGINPNIIPYGVNYNKWKYSKTPSTYFKILHVGTITPLKNQEQSIRTIAEIGDRIPNLRLSIIGDDSDTKYVDYLNKLSQQLGVFSKVFIHSNIGREQLVHEYQTASLLLHPVKDQGGWLTPLEAICCELTPIISFEFTASKLFASKGLGIITANYAGNILGFYERQDFHNQLTLKAKSWIKNNLTWEKFTDGMIQEFELAIKVKNA